jgi:hypothetical protein
MMAKVETTETDVPNDVKAAIEGVLRRRLAAYGYRGADIRVTSDMDGDPILMIDVHYSPVDGAVSSKATFGLVTQIRETLAKLREGRFPHVRHHFAEGQKIAS